MGRYGDAVIASRRLGQGVTNERQKIATIGVTHNVPARVHPRQIRDRAINVCDGDLLNLRGHIKFVKPLTTRINRHQSNASQVVA